MMQKKEKKTCSAAWCKKKKKLKIKWLPNIHLAIKVHNQIHGFTYDHELLNVYAGVLCYQEYRRLLF